MNPTAGEVLLQVNRIVCDVLEDNTIQLKYETSARDVKGWDSLNHIQLVVAIERHFKIRFNFTELQKFKNVGEMCDNILAKLGVGATQT